MKPVYFPSLYIGFSLSHNGFFTLPAKSTGHLKGVILGVGLVRYFKNALLLKIWLENSEVFSKSLWHF